MSIRKEVLDEVALSESEYNLIAQQLGREPTEVELGIFGSLLGKAWRNGLNTY